MSVASEALYIESLTNKF